MQYERYSSRGKKFIHVVKCTHTTWHQARKCCSFACSARAPPLTSTCAHMGVKGSCAERCHCGREHAKQWEHACTCSGKTCHTAHAAAKTSTSYPAGKHFAARKQSTLFYNTPLYSTSFCTILHRSASFCIMQRGNIPHRRAGLLVLLEFENVLVEHLLQLFVRLST
jgi:hypothetical protein